MAKWFKIKCQQDEIALNVVLTNGQSFRWKKRSDDGWISVLYDKVWLIKQEADHICYQVFDKGYGLNETKCTKKEVKHDHIINVNRPKKHCHGYAKKTYTNIVKINCSLRTGMQNQLSSKGTKSFLAEDVQEEKFSDSEQFKISEKYFNNNETILRNYFQLDISLCDLYRQWSDKDLHFKKTAQQFKGIRQLQQDPVENLFSFICSSNNNISRISSMIEAMCERFGEKIAVVDGEPYYSFPTIQALAGSDVEQILRKLKFGYRAKYISETAKYLQKKDPEWLYILREKSYIEVWHELCKMSGVGAKVADCICLMSMRKHDAIPVDTHVFQLALRDYCKYPQISKHKGAKTVTPTVYRDIGNFFRELWGEYAGWAQTVLFSAELPHFREVKTQSKKVSKRKLQEEKVSPINEKKKKKIS